MKLQNKWIMSLGIAMLMGFACTNVSYGMEEPTGGDELTTYFKELIENGELPQDVQSHIRRLQLMRNAIRFLGGLHLVATTPTPLQGGHAFAVRSVAISGNTVVTGSDDKTAKLWDISNGQFRLAATTPTQDGHDSWVSSVAISGDRVVTGSSDKTAKLWDISNDQFRLVATTPTPLQGGHDSWVSSVAISGDRVVTGSSDKTAKLWDISNDQFRLVATTPTPLQVRLVATTPTPLQGGHTDSVYSVAISGDRVVTGSSDKTAKLWDISNDQFKLVATTPTQGGHAFAVSSVAISGNTVVTGSMDNTAKLWDIRDGQFRLVATTSTQGGHTNWVNSVAISGDRLVTGSYDKTAKLWDIRDGQFRLVAITPTQGGHTGLVSSVAISGNTVVTGSSDNTAKLWSLSLDLTGTPEDNPLLWLIHYANITQADFVNRLYKAAISKEDLIIAMPEKLGEIKADESQEQRDGRTYFSFPEHVRAYLRKRFGNSIRKK